MDEQNSPVLGQAFVVGPANDLEAPSSNGEAGQRKGGGRPKSMVWQYYTKVGNADEKSKRCEVHCNACQARFQSRVEIMEAHLAQTCKAAAEELKHMMRERIRHKAEDRARKEQAANEIKAAAPVPALPSALAVPLPQAKRFKPEEGRAVETMIPLRLRFPQLTGSATVSVSTKVTKIRHPLTKPTPASTKQEEHTDRIVIRRESELSA